MDNDGLIRIYMTLGQIGSALQSHGEDAMKSGITDLTSFDQCVIGVDEAQEGLLKFLQEHLGIDPTKP